jgi:hypothetical protein
MQRRETRRFAIPTQLSSVPRTHTQYAHHACAASEAGHPFLTVRGGVAEVPVLVALTSSDPLRWERFPICCPLLLPPLLFSALVVRNVQYDLQFRTADERLWVYTGTWRCVLGGTWSKQSTKQMSTLEFSCQVEFEVRRDADSINQS